MSNYYELRGLFYIYIIQFNLCVNLKHMMHIHMLPCQIIRKRHHTPINRCQDGSTLRDKTQWILHSQLYVYGQFVFTGSER